MSEWTSPPQFEEQIRQSFGVPQIRTEFVEGVYDKLTQRAAAKQQKPFQFFQSRPAWGIAFILLAVMVFGTLVIGPKRVYAAVRQFFTGYIPGVGLVDQSGPIRILAEPVSLTRDGITISVYQAVLTPVETKLEYGVSGVPLSAYPESEAVSGCMEQPYLRLANGAKIDLSAPIPDQINEATFVLPCIFNTLPDRVPIDWELPLSFVAAPPELTIMPVIDVTPKVAISGSDINQISETPITNLTQSPLASITVDSYIETADGYILFGSVRPNIPEGSWLQITGAATIMDADGNKINYTFPTDVQPLNDSSLSQGGYAWAMQIKGAKVQFPITIRFSGVVISQVDPQASARIIVDVGDNPKPDQVWEINQDIQLGEHTIRLISITANSINGYSFHIDPGSELSGVNVQIDGHQAVGGGGGSGWRGPFHTSLAYSVLPQGQLTILFTNPLSASFVDSWEVQWQPEIEREFSASTSDQGICWNANTIHSVPLLPEGLDGRVVFTQLNPQLQLVLANMDGSQQQILAAGAARAALSQDGTSLAYSIDEGIGIQNLISGEYTLMAGIFGRDLHWSPDGNQIAYVSSGDSYGVFVIEKDGENSKQLSNLGYESIAGWSPDGSTLYYAIPGSGGNGFSLRAVDVNTGDMLELFTLKDSSLKAPMPAISPDGKQIAYRASDNSSLYIVSMDGSPTRLLLDNPALAINGIAWERESHLLGASLITAAHPEGEIYLIAPDSCETYRLPGLSGALDGVLVP